MHEYRAALLGLGGGIVGAFVVVVAFALVMEKSNMPTTTPAPTVRAVSMAEAGTATPAATNIITQTHETTTTMTPQVIDTPALTSTSVPTATPIPTGIPTPTPGIPWTNAIVAVDGYTVSYPSDWVINTASSQVRFTTITSWVPTGPGGMDGVPQGGLLINISLTDDPIPSSGDNVQVGNGSYLGIMTTGDLTDPDPFWDPKLIRNVYYEAEGSKWLIKGIFGDDVSDANPNFPIFIRIVRSITHVNAAAPTPTPVPTPTEVPVATDEYIANLKFDDVIRYFNLSDYYCTDSGSGITIEGTDVSETLQCTSTQFTGLFLVRIVGPNTSKVRNVLIVTYASNPNELINVTARRIFQSTLFCFLPHSQLGYAGQWITESIGGRNRAIFGDVPFTISDNPDAEGVSWLFMAGWP